MTAGLLAPLLALLSLPAAVPSSAAVERVLLVSEDSAVVEMRTAALIMSGQEGGALPIATAVIPDGKACVADRVACRFTAVVEVDGAALLGDGTGSLTVEVFAYVLGIELDVVEQQTLSLDLDVAAHREPLASTGLKAFLRFETAPGNYQLRVLVQAGEVFGLRGLELSVEPPAGVPVPVFHELAGPWLLAAPAGVEIPLPPPFGLPAGSPLPAVRPQMTAGGMISGQVFNAGDHHDLIAIVRNAGGETLELPLTTLERGTSTVSVSLSMLPSLEPGLWEIAVAGAQGDQEKLADEARGRSSFVPIYIEPVPASAVADGSEKPTDAPDADPKPTATGAQRKLARAASKAYVRALRQLAAGRAQAARSTLMASEQRVVQALDADAVDVLAQAESRVLASLADADWECALPAILLHLDLSRAYRQGGQRILAHHATQMTTDLANAYSRKRAEPQAAAVAARVFSSLGGYLQERNALSQAERLFTRALELAADDTAALLGLGTLYEKRGLADQAVPMLERLVAALPEHAEGALRLALNHARTGRLEAAKQALDALLARSDNDWVALLAHQELARLLIDEGQLSRAAAILRQGLERWSGHPTLQIQLAWVLDAQGEDASSLGLLQHLGGTPVSVQSASERSRYNRWSGDLLAASRRALAEAAGARRGDLERWLARQNAADGS